MKRFLLSGVLLLTMGRAAFCYENDGTVQVPTMDPLLIQLDTLDGIFVNNGTFIVDTSLFQFPAIQSPIMYETSSTRNFTNNGTMISIPGFDLENFPASVGQAHMLDNFVNNANGTSGGQILALGPTNIFAGGILPTIRVRATNILDSGLLSVDSLGLIDVVGGDVNLDHSRFLMAGGSSFSNTTAGVTTLDYGWGQFGSNTQPWFPAVDLTPTTALTPFFSSTFNFNIFDEQMSLTNAVVYFQDLNPQPGADGIIVWRGIYLQDNSPSNVTKNVFFDGAGIGNGAFHIEWVGAYRDPVTAQTLTNFFYLSDVPAARRDTNNLPFPFPPDFSFAESTTRLIPASTQFASPSYANPAPFSSVTNDYSFLNLKPNAVLVDTNSVVGGSVTNLAGRIQLAASNVMNLANTRILGSSYLSLTSPHHLGGFSNAVIASPYSDLNIGVTNGSLIFSNLLVPELPSWSGVPGAPSAVSELALTGNTIGFIPAEMGGLQTWSGSYFFTDANGVTNDVRILLVNSALQPTTPTLQQNVFVHNATNLVLSDELNIFGQFASDATKLTIATNGGNAYSLSGALNLLNQNIFWSASLPNLQFLTNWGVISSKNLLNFAGNMLSPFSPRSGATPYQAFVNHGRISGQGDYIRSDYFENSGVIEESPNGNLDIDVTTGIVTNSALTAINGSVSIASGSLLISNSFINAGRSLTLSASCSMSDGYVLSNMFGHSTNITLPNLVTNGNIFSAGGGVQLTTKPATADLLGTTITNISLNSQDSVNEWAGQDRGATPSGFADNLALGRMIFVTDGNPSRFTFRSVDGNNALYVDSIELQGGATNTDINGNYTAFNFEPGMKVFYAQALANGVSVAEKLNGKNGGGFMWVSNYAGIYSSTNIAYPDGKTYIFNEALVISPDIDTDGDLTVNRDDSSPIPAGMTFDISPVGPQSCDGGVPPFPPGGPDTNSAPIQSQLRFPPHQADDSQSGGAALSFALAQGSYNGLFYETNGVNPAHAGFFSAKVTSKGSFSAKLQLGDATYSVGKAFNSTGNYTSLVTSKSGPPLTVTLHLVNNDQIVGQVSSGTSWTAQLLAVIEAPGAVSKNSLVLSAGTNSPSGDSFGTMTVSKNGDIKWSGVLPDGQKISQKSAASKGGIWPVYSSLYKGSGSFIGWLQLTNNNTEIGGSAVWIVPAKPNGLYPNGLTNNLNATGSSVANPQALSKGTVVLTGPHLSSPLTKDVTISGKSGKSDDKTLTLSVDIKNGLFNGSVVDPASGQTLSFQGALVEKSGMGGGFFLNANKDQGGKVSLAPAN